MTSREARHPNAIFPFVVGCGRSGTTLLRAMLCGHPEMAIPPESPFLVPLLRAHHREKWDAGAARRFISALAINEAFGRWQLPLEAVSARLTDYPTGSVQDAVRCLYRCWAESKSKRRYGDKTPKHVLNMPLLAKAFPESRFLHIIRDGRDVALSLQDAPWGPKDVFRGVLYWQRHVSAGQAAGLHLGSTRYLEVHYERLVDSPEDVLRSVCRFLALDFDASMLRTQELAGAMIASDEWGLRAHANLTRPISTRLRDWRKEMSREDAALVDRIARRALASTGYDQLALSRSERRHATRRWLEWQLSRAARRLPRARDILGRRTSVR